ncbi:MAG: tetratricopeptide repeat protein [Lentisphaerota bacterium]
MRKNLLLLLILAVCLYPCFTFCEDNAISYRKAAEQGDAEAQKSLGTCYLNGWGVATDQAEAVKWYRKAAEQQYEKAQFNLGTCYQNGWGVAVDKAEAVKWYRKAAEKGFVNAQNNLGACYLNG